MNKFSMSNWFCLPSENNLSLSHARTHTHTQTTDYCVVLSADIPSVFERQEAKGDSNSVSGTSHSVDRVKILVADHVRSVTERPVAVDSGFWVKET
jgi:hypothetical protein